jgi:ketosteroid isomerase-like protein
MRKSLLFVFLLLLMACNAGNDEGSSADKADARKVIDGFTDFYTDKEISRIDRLFSDAEDVIVIGLTSGIWKGKKSIKKNVEKTMDQVDDSNLSIRDKQLKIHGDVAWFSQRGDWSYEFNNQRVELKGVRMTGVLRKEGGNWKIVQWHTSNPVR